MDTERRTHDEWIALRCQAGAPGAFEDLIAVMERPLLYYAIKLTGSQDSALEVLQETWIKAFRGIRRMRDPASLRPWLYRIVHGIAVDRIRRNCSRERAEDIHAETFQEAEAPAFAAQHAAAVHRALDELAPKYRDVLVLYFLEDFSVAQIAEVIDCPEGTVKSRLHHARKAMKLILLRGGYGTEG